MRGGNWKGSELHACTVLQSASFSAPDRDPGITELEGDWGERVEGLGQRWSETGLGGEERGGKACGEVGGMGQTLSGYTETTSNFHQRAM